MSKVTDRHTAIDYAHVLRRICPIRIFQMRRKSCRCRIISTSTSQPRFMRPLSRARQRPAGSSSASNGTTRLSTAAGSTWPNPNSAFSNVAEMRSGIAASPTSRYSPSEVTAWQDHQQQAPRQSRLATIHNRQRPRQAEETVPSVRVTRATSPPFPKFESYQAASSSL